MPALVSGLDSSARRGVGWLQGAESVLCKGKPLN